MGVFGLLLFCAGIFTVLMGWKSSPRSTSAMGIGALLFFGGLLIAIGGSPSRDLPNGSKPAVVFGLIITAIAGVLTYIESKKSNEKKKAEEEEKLLEIGGTKLDRFFVECVLASCDDFSLQKNVEKAKLLAAKYSLDYRDGIEVLFQEGLKAHEAISGKLISDRLETLRSAEREEYYLTTKYASYYGKEKRKKMLTDRMDDLRTKAKLQQEGADLLLRSTQQQEQDWALLGGIASGIAGTAAGVATAWNVQAKNAEIRAQNAANMRAAMPNYMTITGSASQNRANADAIEKEIAALDEKLISDMPADDFDKYLEIINSEVEVSETGAFRVTATARVKNPVFIYDDVPATIDGTIIAHVYEDNREIGTATMVLPVNGVNSSTGLVGISLSGANPNKEHTVSYNAGKLWMIER